MKFKVFLGVLLLISTLVTSCRTEEQKGESVRKVKCEVVSQINNTQTQSSYTGKVYAASDVNLSFRVAGIIDRIASHEGAYVRKGQVVAYMDNRDYQLQLNATQAEADAVTAEAERVIALYKDNSVSTNDYDKAVNGLKRINAKLDSHRNALSDTELKAPFDGYIQKINFGKGEAVAAGTPIMSFVSASAPEVVVNLPIKEYLKRGKLTSAEATIEVLSGEVFPLKLIGVTQKANLNQLYSARFMIESTKGVMPTAGMTASVTMSYESDSVALFSIPLTAVIERDGSTYVWLLDNGVAKLNKVETGTVKANGNVEVKSGLSNGQVLITAGIHNLKEGQKVEALAQSSKSNVGGIL